MIKSFFSSPSLFSFDWASNIMFFSLSRSFSIVSLDFNSLSLSVLALPSSSSKFCSSKLSRCSLDSISIFLSLKGFNLRFASCNKLLLWLISIVSPFISSSDWLVISFDVLISFWISSSSSVASDKFSKSIAKTNLKLNKNIITSINHHSTLV